jgi:hypothetical protein
MFPVVAPSSPPLPWILIGSSSGNRFPVLASSDIHYTPQQTPLAWGIRAFLNDGKLTNQRYTTKKQSRVDGVQLRWPEKPNKDAIK